VVCFLAGAAFFAALCAFAASARFSAQRFFVAAMIAALPALLSFRFGFAGSVAAGAGGSDSLRSFAHRSRWASFMCRRAAADNFLRFRGAASDMVAVSTEPPDRIAASSATLVSMCRFCYSNPRMAAVMISGVSFVGM